MPWRIPSAIDFRIVRPFENIIDAHAVKIGEQNERFRGRDALAGFVFGKQRLLDAGRYLQGELRHFALLAEETEVVWLLLHKSIMALRLFENMTIRHINE